LHQNRHFGVYGGGIGFTNVFRRNNSRTSSLKWNSATTPHSARWIRNPTEILGRKTHSHTSAVLYLNHRDWLSQLNMHVFKKQHQLPIYGTKKNEA